MADGSLAIVTGDAQISPVLTEQHQHTRHEERHDQLPDGEVVDPAGQTLHTVEVDPGEEHHQDDGDSQTASAENLCAVPILREPGQAAVEIIEHG